MTGLLSVDEMILFVDKSGVGQAMRITSTH